MQDSFHKAKSIASKLLAAGATKSVLVGGWVRDHLLNIESKDLDIEVYGLNYSQIDEVLSKDYSVNYVGQSFGILKIGADIDVSIPRRENKIGIGHKGFHIQIDPNMSLEEAAMRRDFTVNSIAMDFEGHFYDPFQGKKDLENKILRSCSAAFKEDPLRVLRGMQFSARFGFRMEPNTVKMCKQLLNEFDTIAKERIFDEWKKWALKGDFPKFGLDLLQETEWIQKFPILQDMAMTLQDPIWHPEGDVYVHTGHVCNAAVEISKRENLSESDRMALLFGALCHDMGKPKCTVKNEVNRWVAPKHADLGVPIAADFLKQINAPKHLVEIVKPMVKEHMAHVSLQEGDPSHRTIRRLANRLAPASIYLWSLVCESDASGRPPLPKSNPVKRWISVANDLAVRNRKPKPLLMGRHLIEFGINPGPKMGRILNSAFEQQLDGTFGDVAGALEWVKSRQDIFDSKSSTDS